MQGYRTPRLQLKPHGTRTTKNQSPDSFPLIFRAIYNFLFARSFYPCGLRILIFFAVWFCISLIMQFTVLLKTIIAKVSFWDHMKKGFFTCISLAFSYKYKVKDHLKQVTAIYHCYWIGDIKETRSDTAALFTA